MIAALFCVLLLAGGCASSASGLHSQATQVQLREGNYKVVSESVHGTSTSFKVFGIGPSATFAEAMKNLRAKALLLDPDSKPRALINVTQDETFTLYFGIVMVSEIIFTADVIEWIR